ncbi:polyubiquitin [Artemisia annua]|uniref:Polyubiquitin n=1 Tax=Artemisia annua TaxID=35608 RepID=A0A2U1KN19_ARTAN|nr:polyubiquitin [Artemisia annua]
MEYPKDLETIYIQTVTQKTFSLGVSPSTNLGEVKTMIRDKEGLGKLNQRLFFAGMQNVKIKRTLSDYNITGNSVLYLVPVCRGDLKITVETISGKRIPLDVDCRHTVKELKALIQDKELGIHPDQQALVYAGHRLEDGIILSRYSVQNESTVRLVDDTVTRLQIYFLIDVTGKTIHLEVESSDTIHNEKSIGVWVEEVADHKYATQVI